MIGIIGGAGTIGSIIVKSLSRTTDEEIVFSDRTGERSSQLQKDLGIQKLENEELVKQSRVVFVCVKPQDFMNFEAFKSAEGKTIISVMAGVNVQKIQSIFPEAKVVRTMPNLGGQVGKSMTAWFTGDDVTDEEIEMLLNSFGKCIKVKNEDDIDKSTALIGSGPSYLYFLIKLLEEKSQEMGFSKEDASFMIEGMLDGGFSFFQQSNLSPAELIEQVRSKGGTTNAALNTLEEEKVSEKFKAAIEDAYKRAQELSK